jgi:hypothetical protein
MADEPPVTSATRFFKSDICQSLHTESLVVMPSFVDLRT